MYSTCMKIFLLFRLLASVHGTFFSNKAFGSEIKDNFLENNGIASQQGTISFTRRQLYSNENSNRIFKHTFFAISSNWSTKNESNHCKSTRNFAPSSTRFQRSSVRCQQRLGQERRLTNMEDTRRLSREERRSRSPRSNHPILRNVNEVGDTRRILESRRRESTRSDKNRERRTNLSIRVTKSENLRVRQNRRYIDNFNYDEMIRKDRKNNLFRNNVEQIRMQSEQGSTRFQNTEYRRESRGISNIDKSKRAHVRESEVRENGRKSDQRIKSFNIENGRYTRWSRILDEKSRKTAENVRISRDRTNANMDSSSMERMRRVRRSATPTIEVRRQTLHLRQINRNKISVFQFQKSLKRQANAGFDRRVETRRIVITRSLENLSPLGKTETQRSFTGTRKHELRETNREISKTERLSAQRTRFQLHSEQTQERRDSLTNRRVLETELRQDVQRREARVLDKRMRINTLRMDGKRGITRYETAAHGPETLHKKEEGNTDSWWEKDIPKSLNVVIVTLLLISQFHAIAKEAGIKKVANIGSSFGSLFGLTEA